MQICLKNNGTNGHRLANFFVVLAILTAGVCIQPPPALGNVTKTFIKADRLFKKGQYRRAQKVLAANIQKYPGHEPSQLLMGRLYYRFGKVGKAAKAFKKISADLLSPDMAYEYGIVFFMTKSYDRAVKGFARVGKKARQIHLANFYRGVCYMKSNQWERARRYILRAKKLPRNLVSSKRKLLNTLKRKISNQRRGLITPGIGTTVVVPRPPQQYQPPVQPGPGPVPGAPKPKEAKPEPPPPPSSGFQSSISPSFSYEQKQKSLTYHGFRDEQNESTEIILGASWSGRYDAEPVSSGGQPYVQTKVSFDQTNSSSTGTSVKYVAPADDPTNLREVPEEVAPTDSKAANIKVVPEVGYPVGGFLDLTGSYTVSEKYPDGQAEEKSGYRTPFASALLSVFTLGIKGSFSMKESYDALGTVTKTSTTLKGEVDKDIDTISLGGSYTTATDATPDGPANPEVTTTYKGQASKAFDSFSLALSGALTEYLPPSGQVKSGEQSATTFELSGSKSFDFGGTLSLTGTLKQKADIHTEHKDPKPEPGTPEEEIKMLPMKSQGTEQKFTAAFSLSPISWLSGTVTFVTQKNEFTPGDPQFATEFEEENAEISSEFKLKLVVKTSF